MTGPPMVTAVAAFAGTTIDDLVILSALFVARRATGRPRVTAIMGGQYVGFVAILACALLAAAGLAVIPQRWIGLLGLVPVGFGLWSLWRLRGTDGQSGPVLAVTGTRIAALTFANGADNISVFTPLFRTLGWGGSLVAVGEFLVLIAVWCGAGALLGGHAAMVGGLSRVGHWLVPVVFIAVGAVIVTASGLPGEIGRLL